MMQLNSMKSVKFLKEILGKSFNFFQKKQRFKNISKINKKKTEKKKFKKMRVNCITMISHLMGQLTWVKSLQKIYKNAAKSGSSFTEIYFWKISLIYLNFISKTKKKIKYK